MGKEKEPKALQSLQETLLRKLNPEGYLAEIERLNRAVLTSMREVYGIESMSLPLSVYSLTPDQGERICRDLNKYKYHDNKPCNPFPQITKVMQELEIIDPSLRYRGPYTIVNTTAYLKWVSIEFGWSRGFDKDITQITQEGKRPIVANNTIWFDLNYGPCKIPLEATGMHISNLTHQIHYSGCGSILLFSQGTPCDINNPPILIPGLPMAS